MAMDASPPWADLLDAAVFEIVRRIPCAFDRIHANAVCRSWRAALVQLPPPRALPGFILWKDDGPTLSCIVAGGCTHPIFVPNAFRRARYFGSYDGSWLFLAVGQHNGHALLSLNNLQVIDLPNQISLRLLPRQRSRSVMIVLVAATLSYQPNEQGFIVGGIIDILRPHRLRCIAFWRMNSNAASISKVFWTVESDRRLEDIIYRNRAFHFLNEGESICVCTPNFLLEEADARNRDAVRYIRPRIGHLYNRQCVAARCLVESRKQLLMVVKLTPDLQSPASAFRVFRMDEQTLNDEVQYSWEEMHTLDGRMLFVARGCSRSYEMAAYPGLKSGIYFLDGRSWHDRDIVLRDVAARQYDCSGIGKWSGTPPQVELCVPDEGPSNYSPPVWFIP